MEICLCRTGHCKRKNFHTLRYQIIYVAIYTVDLLTHRAIRMLPTNDPLVSHILRNDMGKTRYKTIPDLFFLNCQDMVPCTEFLRMKSLDTKA